jgi:SOS-response transcriptional repressor LexA
MTPESLRLLDFIRARIDAAGLPPTYSEMLAHMGLRGRGVVHAMVDGLVKDGLLVRRPGRPRGLRLPNLPDLAGVPTSRLEAELRRRKRHPAWSPEFRASIGRPPNLLHEEGRSNG